MKKALNIIFITIFMGMCALPLAGIILGHKNVNAEKRALAPPPEVFTKEGFNAGFTREFDDYFTDNFAFRTDLVTLYAGLNSALLGESISDQVIIGKEGWLFFEPTLGDYMKTGTLSGNEIRRLAETLEMQRDYVEGRGAAFIFTVTPNKASVYGQYMPDRYKALGGSSNAENLFRELDGRGFKYVDLFKALRGGDIQLYHKLDTHWNNAGALIGYNALLGRVKELTPRFSFDTHEDTDARLERTWEGDLSGMLYPAAGLLDAQYTSGIEKKYTAKRPIKSLEDITIETQSENGDTDLVMFRDSFADALIPMISNEFESVTYSRAVPYDYSLLNTDTDVVMLEIVERNIPEMLERAPIIPAQLISPAEAGISGAAGADMDITIKTEDKGGYIKIAGVALPPGYSSDKDYDIFIRLGSEDKASGVSRLFYLKPFPILEKDLFDGYGQNSNAAFSMIIGENNLPPGQYSIDVIVSDGKEYYIDSAGTTAVIPRR